jgi:hypothetical protein
MASTSGRMDGALGAIETPAQRRTVDIVLFGKFGEIRGDRVTGLVDSLGIHLARSSVLLLLAQHSYFYLNSSGRSRGHNICAVTCYGPLLSPTTMTYCSCRYPASILIASPPHCPPIEYVYSAVPMTGLLSAKREAVLALLDKDLPKWRSPFNSAQRRLSRRCKGSTHKASLAS